ncbi:MAG: hypothetical protein C3F11_18465 [Methylocystaceae bacterium]|nr:MAG: hypothetical protein C3F11_18465 [Methylocystaceae bacterium]
MPARFPLDLDRLLAALSLLSLLLYLTPAVSRFDIPRHWRRRLQFAAIATLATGLGIALTASVIWFAP